VIRKTVESQYIHTYVSNYGNVAKSCNKRIGLVMCHRSTQGERKLNAIRHVRAPAIGAVAS